MSSIRRLTLLFTSDEHGHLAGAPAIHGEVTKARQENPDGTLVLSSGDVFQGAPESELEHGQPGRHILDLTGYDVIALGNHDFDYCPDYTRQMVREGHFQVVCSNVKQEDGALLEGVESSVVLTKKGVTIGIVGGTTETTPKLGSPDMTAGLTFDPAVDAIGREASQLKEQGVDLVIALTHQDEDQDYDLAQQSNHIDILHGGHKHTFYQTPRQVNQTMMVRSGYARGAVTRLDIDYDVKRQKVVSFQHRLIAIDENSERPDDEVTRIVEGYLRSAEEKLGTVVSYTPQELRHDSVKDDPLDLAVARALALEAGTEIALFNNDMIRAGFEAGDVTAEELKKAFPFDDQVAKIRVTKEQLTAAVQQSLDYGNKRSLFLKGLRVSTHQGERGLQLDSLTLSDGSSLPDTLEVATSGYLSEGGLDYFPQCELLTKTIQVRDAFENYLDLHANDEEPGHDVSRQAAAYL